jgi:hypothetical protein
VTDEMTELVRRLIESDDIEEVRELRQRLNALIRARMDELRSRAASLAADVRKREEAKKQRA